MRLWPLCIIDQLPRQQLLGQHRECCALRGKGWGRKHRTVDYVFRHPFFWLVVYHWCIIDELISRGYAPEDKWNDYEYRGKVLGVDNTDFTKKDTNYVIFSDIHVPLIYPEHDEKYLDECIENLRKKGITIDRKRAIERPNAA